MDNENKNLIAALKYYAMGFSVIPVGRNKKPLVAWQQYQTNRASKEQIERWFSDKDVNVGIVTGAISGVVVVDIDTQDKIERPLPQTATSQTGRGGWHLFYKHPGRHVKTLAGILPHVDIRGDGGYVVMPPSLHENGNHYEWVFPPEENDFAELPQWVFEEKLSQEAEQNSGQSSIDTSVQEGKRNDTATRIAGKLLSQLKDKNLWGFAWDAMKEWNRSK